MHGSPWHHYVLADTEHCFYVSARSIEHELLELAFGDKVNYVGQADELAVLAALETFDDLLADEDVVSFVDNQGALGVLVSGSSTRPPTVPWVVWPPRSSLCAAAHARALLLRVCQLCCEHSRSPVQGCGSQSSAQTAQSFQGACLVPPNEAATQCGLAWSYSTTEPRVASYSTSDPR